MSLGTALNMFHGRFVEGPEYDESFFAKDMVKYTNGIYQEVIPTAKQFVEQLPRLIYALDEPSQGRGSSPNTLSVNWLGNM